jgi:glucose/arabinose dehydrogenase
LELQQWKTPHHPAIQNLFFCTLQNHSEGRRQETEYTDRYEWDQENQVLINGTMILGLPAEPESVHNGGKLETDRNGNLYAVIGDLSRDGQLQNVRRGPAADNTSVIIRIIQNGSGTADNPFSKSNNEKMQYTMPMGYEIALGWQ